MKFIDITGNRYGSLVALKVSEKRNGNYYWECVCDCGNKKSVLNSNLKSGNVRTCGDKKVHHIKHGMRQSRIYKTWRNMKSRCDNPNATYYEYYGGKDIKYCDEWKEFTNFYEWAIKSGYKDNLTIERVDFNGDYKPSNCCWITKSEQNKNTSKTLNIEINGITKTLKGWADEVGVTPPAMSHRYKKGLRGAELIQPTMRRRKKNA